MMATLEIDVASLPIIWDADFLYGPRSASGKDTYVLCEINVSSVLAIISQTKRRPKLPASLLHAYEAALPRDRVKPVASLTGDEVVLCEKCAGTILPSAAQAIHRVRAATGARLCQLRALTMPEVLSACFGGSHAGGNALADQR
jgi:hypothetical protein